MFLLVFLFFNIFKYGAHIIIYKDMKIHNLTKKPAPDHFESPPQLYIIFKKIVESTDPAVYHPLDIALLNLCKLHCNIENGVDTGNYYKNKFNEHYEIWQNSGDWQNMCICSIYAYLYYKYCRDNDLINRISKSIKDSHILEAMINLGRYPRLVGFSLGLISNAFSDYDLQKLLSPNANTEKKVFVLYYYFGKKISNADMQINKEIQELAENVIIENTLDFNIRMPALVFYRNPNKYFDKVVSEFVSPVFYELAFGTANYTGDKFNFISDLYVENIVKYLLISKILGWDIIYK